MSATILDEFCDFMIRRFKHQDTLKPLADTNKTVNDVKLAFLKGRQDQQKTITGEQPLPIGVVSQTTVTIFGDGVIQCHTRSATGRSPEQMVEDVRAARDRIEAQLVERFDRCPIFKRTVPINEAGHRMREGLAVRRRCWPPSWHVSIVQPGRLLDVHTGQEVEAAPFVARRTEDQIGPYQLSHDEIVADDWELFTPTTKGEVQ